MFTNGSRFRSTGGAILFWNSHRFFSMPNGNSAHFVLPIRLKSPYPSPIPAASYSAPEMPQLLRLLAVNWLPSFSNSTPSHCPAKGPMAWKRWDFWSDFWWICGVFMVGFSGGFVVNWMVNGTDDEFDGGW